MLSLSLKSMNVLPYSMFKCVLSVRRLENVRSLFFLAISQNQKNNAWKGNLRYFATKKDENSSSSSSSDSSSDSSSSDEEDEKESPKVPDNKEDEKQASSYVTNQKLQGLLRSMIDPNSKQEESVTSMLLNETMKKDEVKVTFGSASSEKVKNKSENFDEDVEKAAYKVAESLGGDVQKTESELLNRLLSRQKKEQETDSSKNTSVNLSELIVGMKIDRTPASSPPGYSYPSFQRSGAEPFGIKEKFTPRQEKERRPLQGFKARSRSFEPSVNLYAEGRLGIFDPSVEDISQPPLKTWQHLYQRELSLSAIHPPANIFEEMIRWTEKGILWKFPINNEQGLEEETTVPFSEHVFLEKYLVPWCPSKGPIRHFMELVCVGLSKNSFMRVEEKKETILWYRDYFQKKKDVLKATGIDLDAEVKQIETQ